MDVLAAAYLLRNASGDAGLAAGIAAVAAGESATAVESLAAVVDSSDDPVVLVRAAAYHRLATHLRWNAFPGGGGASSTEIQVRWDGQPSEVETSRDWAALTAQVADPAVLLETRMIGGTLCSLLSARAVVDFAAVRYEPDQVDAQLEELLQMLAPLREVDDPMVRGYADFAAADLARRAQRPGRAVQLLRDAAAAYGTVGDTLGLAACHLARGDWRAAPAGSPETRNLTLQAGAASSALDWALESREASLEGLDVESAEAAYDDAEETLGEAGEQAGRGLAALALRRSYLAGLAGDHAQAAEHAGAAAASFDSSGDRWGAWLARTHEALAAVGSGRLTEGTAVVEQVGRWGRTTGSFSYAEGLGLLCARSGRDWLYRRADPERALAAYRLARTLFAALGAVTDESQSLVDRGHTLQVLGDQDGAAAAYEEALDLLSADISGRPTAAPDNRLRAVLLAQTLYSLHLSHRNLTGMARSVERVAAQLARLPAEPEEGSMDAVFASAGQDTLAQASVLLPTYRAEDARDAGDTAGAEAGFAAALEAVRDSGTDDADFLEAVVLGHARRFPEASVAYRRHLARLSSPATGLVGRVLSRIGPLKAETELAQQRIHEQAAAFYRRLRDYPASVEHFEELERRGGADWWSRLERPWELLTDYGTVREGLGELDRALELYDQAIAQLERRRARLRRDELRTALSGTTGAAAVYLAAARTAQRASEAAATAGDRSEADAMAARAFDYAERGRARGLLDLLGASMGLARSTLAGPDTVRAWQQANTVLSMRQGLLAAEQNAADVDQARLAALREEVRTAEDELARREAELERDDPAFAATVAVPADVLPVEEVAAALTPGTAMLAYHHLEEDLLTWAVTREGIVASHRAAVDAAQLMRDIRAFSEACAKGRNWDLRGADLARTLLDPFAEVIEGSDGLIVIPFAGAHAMPFHALPWHAGALGARHPLSYLPSASSLQFLRRGGTDLPDRVLAVGDPAGTVWQALPGQDPGPAKPLAGAATEAAFVAALFGESRLLLGDEATEEAVRAEIGAFPVVHLATHGQVSEEAPLLSSVLLADGEALSVYELMGIHLDADLVVLSACDTGVGRSTAGGDVLGLTRGLLGAGARGVVVSLWPARDRSTCVLMANFYRRLRAGTAPVVALQRAQAHLRGMHRDTEAAEYAALRAAVGDPAGAADLLAPLDDTEGAGPEPTRDRHPEVWATFCYIGL